MTNPEPPQLPPAEAAERTPADTGQLPGEPVITTLPRTSPAGTARPRRLIALAATGLGLVVVVACTLLLTTRPHRTPITLPELPIRSTDPVLTRTTTTTAPTATTSAGRPLATAITTAVTTRSTPDIAPRLAPAGPATDRGAVPR